MGKATRWLKGLLGIKKDKDPSGNSDSKPTPVVSDRKEKKRWSFAKSGRDSGQTPPPTVAVESAWFSSYISDSEKEQNKHAIAVAAATAAAADAAVAAAQAAVAVVRLTSQRRGPLYTTGRDRWAAVKIQTVFKGYLVSKILQFLPNTKVISYGIIVLFTLFFHLFILFCLVKVVHNLNETVQPLSMKQ